MRRRGFTLVELMVVVGVIAVLALASIPAFTGMMSQARVDAAVADVQNALGRARSLAMSYRMVYTIEFATVTHPSGLDVAVVYIDTGRSRDANGQLIGKGTAPATGESESQESYKFETLSDFDDATKVGTTFVPEPYVLEGVTFSTDTDADGDTDADDKAVANAGYPLKTGTESDGGQNWPDIAISPEGYLMEGSGERRIRLLGNDGQERVIEFMRFGSLRLIE